MTKLCSYNSDINSMSHLPMDQFEKLCRICVSEKIGMKSIFQSDIVHKILACASVQIGENDGLPKQICQQCTNLLNWSYYFKGQCERADQLLRSHITQETFNDTKLENINFPSVNFDSLPEFYSHKTDDSKISNISVVEKDIKIESEPDDVSKSDYCDEIIENGKITIKTEKKTDRSRKCKNKKAIVTRKKVECKKDKLHKSNNKSALETESKLLKDYIRCRDCRMRFTLQSDLDIHMIAHSENHNNICSICEEDCKDIRNLRKHLSVHMKHKPFFFNKAHLCNVCGKGFGYPKLLSIHMRQHTGEKPFECPECNKHFIGKHHLQVHIRFTHKGALERKHVCDICKKAFIQKKTLKNHLVVHTKEKPFSCMVCNKRFTQAQYVPIHMLKHTGNWPLSCKECGMGFSRQSKLDIHMRVHTGLKPHMCDVCGRGFAQSNGLKLHIRTHTGEKPFPCSECPLRFVAKHQLESHMRKHTGVHPYLCPTCGKSFAWRQNLRKHILVHTGERPYKCVICEHKFTDPSALSKHKKTHGETVHSKSNVS